MCSSPPETITSDLHTLILFAANEIELSPDEHIY